VSALSVYRFDGADVRTVIIDGEPWFFALDVAIVLGYSATSAMTRTLDGDEKGVHTLHTPGGPQDSTIISEAGLFSAIIRSRVPSAREFKRWVTHEVLPSIRRTGSYSTVPALTEDEIVHQALAITARRVEALETKVADLTPRAEAWDELASADGDYEVADAAKILARAGVETGRQRLFNQLSSLGWIYRSPQGKWKARQTAVDKGYLREKPQSHHHPRTGELVLDPPQVRVTLRGIERLRVRLGVLTAVEVSA
jgi:anti-repressor protein